MDMKQLYEPYSEKASLDVTLGWINKQATNLGITSSVVQAAVAETFLDMENGKEFDKTGAGTGFEGFPHAALNLYLLERIKELHAEATNASNRVLEGVLTKKVDVVAKGEQKGMRRFLNCNNSPILKILRIA